jgi:hypothetical protein
MMRHVCGLRFRYRRVENGIRISTIQPRSVTRAAESQNVIQEVFPGCPKKSGDAFSPDASSVTASY